MQAEVIAIGDELTSGQRLDTNSPWLSERLGELGVRVLYHTTVGDDLEANAQVFRVALERAAIVVCTGGLGPTADDLTRHALAQATGTTLELHADVLDQIRALFARRRRQMPERNEVQAMFPQTARVIPNPHGSAPGIDMVFPLTGEPRSRLFALPGVPAEMREMWQSTVEPAVRRMMGRKRVIRHRRIKCFGVGESDLEAMLPDIIRRGRSPAVGITVSRATITLRITAEGETPEECEAQMVPTIETIHRCLGDLVFGGDDDELQHAVIRLLHERNETLAVAEWGSGGLLSEWLSEADPATRAFVGSLVVRDTRLVGQIFGHALPADKAPGRRTVAAAMAQHCRDHFGTHYGLAIGEFPQSDSPTSRPGRVAFALATPEQIKRKGTPFAGHPDILASRATKQALDFLRRNLLDPEAGPKS